MTATAYRWHGRGSVHWLIIYPGGRSQRDRCATEAEANMTISALSRAAGCSLTVIVRKHPNDADARRPDA